MSFDQEIVCTIIAAAFWIYWPAALYLEHEERTSYYSPIALFFSSVLFQILLIFLVFLAVIISSLRAVLLVGVFGWIWPAAQWYAARANTKRFRCERPLPKMQCSMIDIYTAMLYFAFFMALNTAGAKVADARVVEDAVLPFAGFLLLATCLGFYVVLDVLRREPAPSSRIWRFLKILAVLLVFTMTGILGGLIAWAAWRKALQTVAMEEWNRSRCDAEKQEG